MQEQSLTARIEHILADLAGLAVVVGEHDGAIRLDGVVDSPASRQAAEELAAREAPGRRIENDLEVVADLPVDVAAYQDEEPIAELAEDLEEILAQDGEIEPDFTDQVLGTVGDETSGEGEPYFPPTDPVVAATTGGQLEVVGGFSATSMNTLEVEPSAEDGLPGDEALAEAVRRELREDAATAGLPIQVFVRRGRVHLRGWVAGPEDVDNVEAVAARVPGVLDVLDELDVSGM